MIFNRTSEARAHIIKSLQDDTAEEMTDNEGQVVIYTGLYEWSDGTTRDEADPNWGHPSDESMMNAKLARENAGINDTEVEECECTDTSCKLCEHLGVVDGKKD